MSEPMTEEQAIELLERCPEGCDDFTDETQTFAERINAHRLGASALRDLPALRERVARLEKAIAEAKPFVKHGEAWCELNDYITGPEGANAASDWLSRFERGEFAEKKEGTP